jgi:hypothetical protein
VLIRITMKKMSVTNRKACLLEGQELLAEMRFTFFKSELSLIGTNKVEPVVIIEFGNNCYGGITIGKSPL